MSAKGRGTLGLIEIRVLSAWARSHLPWCHSRIICELTDAGLLTGVCVFLRELAAGSRYRCLSSVKLLLAFGYRIEYLPFDGGWLLRLPSVRNNLAGRIIPEADFHRLLSLEPNEGNRVLLLLLELSKFRLVTSRRVQSDTLKNGTFNNSLSLVKSQKTGRDFALPR